MPNPSLDAIDRINTSMAVENVTIFDLRFHMALESALDDEGKPSIDDIWDVALTWGHEKYNNDQFDWDYDDYNDAAYAAIEAVTGGTHA